MSDLDWLPEAHPVPVELTHDYQAVPYTPPAAHDRALRPLDAAERVAITAWLAESDEPSNRTWATVADQLDAATHEQLLAMAKEVI